MLRLAVARNDLVRRSAVSVCANLALVAMEETVSRGVSDSNLGWLQNAVEHATKHEYYLPLARVSGFDQVLRDVYFHAASSQKVWNGGVVSRRNGQGGQHCHTTEWWREPFTALLDHPPL